jgi:hypothetical protein
MSPAKRTYEPRIMLLSSNETVRHRGGTRDEGVGLTPGNNKNQWLALDFCE